MKDEGRVLWSPKDEAVSRSQLAAFQGLVETRTGQRFDDYSQLHDWSIEEPALFWGAVWDYCEIRARRGPRAVVDDLSAFPGATWFSGAELNFAENLLRRRDDGVALVGLLENGDRRTLSWRELYAAVERLASAMRAHGIRKGDRVAGLLPNIPETVIAMLATTSIGAIWSSCSPDFGIEGACDRFGQIEPRLLFATEAYVYGERTIDSLERVAAIRSRIDSIEKVIVFPLLHEDPELPEGFELSRDFVADADVSLFAFEPLPFDHPLYIMYSSGTTGTPKCIVHGAGGTLLQHLKEHRLHVDLTSEDVFFYFTTCGWMMWNWLISALAVGSTLVLFDGSPFAREGAFLLDAIDDEGITVFGTSAKFLAALEKQGRKPRETHALDSLRTILSTGSPLGHASFEYVYRDVKSDVHLASISGGTDIISCFVLGNPGLPVRVGEIQCPGLGMAVEFWNEGQPAAAGQTGELVCTRPFPSTPIGFWNDGGDRRYRAAYFDRYEGVWTHGDYGERTEHGGIIIHGRSDATLNPAGVRIGTAEIYRQVETVPEVVDSVVVGQKWEDDERVVLFVVLREDAPLDPELIDRIKAAIRTNATPRHVPAKIIAVPDIPRTISGKIVELAVRKIIHGDEVDNVDALANPEALSNFAGIRELST
ncbi:MAG: acetoacetate--CoA ligase [Myxococcota bacterium]